MKKWLVVAVFVGLPSDQPAVVPADERVTNWSIDDDDFGGFSAIEVAADGAKFLALTDQGKIFPGTFLRRSDGHIEEVLTQSFVQLTDETALPLDEDNDDTEGLALRKDGSFLVSLEGPAKILEYPGLGAAARVLPHPAQWNDLGLNAGLEALSFDAFGNLLTIPEDPVNGQYSINLFNGISWSVSRKIEAGTGFRAVALDVGPDGNLYLLERRFLFPGGFASRLQRISNAGQTGDVIWSSPPGRHGNLEGLSIWRDPRHGLIATMISDDNFQNFLSTQIVEITIND